MGLHACHLMGYEEIKKSLDIISKNGAKALCLENYGIEIGKPANLIILTEDNEFDVVRLQANVMYSIRNGKVISETKPKEVKVYLSEEKTVDFK